MNVTCASCGKSQSLTGQKVLEACCDEPKLYCSVRGNDRQSHKVSYGQLLSYQRSGHFKNSVLNIYEDAPESEAESFVLDEKVRKGNDGWIIYRCVHCGSEIKEYPNFKGLCWHQTESKPPKKYSYPFDVVGFDYSKAPNKIKDLVSSKNYGELLIKESAKKIVCEEENKKSLIIQQFGGRLVINAKPTSYNILLTEQSGAGKDYIARNILELLPPPFWNHKTRLSEKALSYWHPSEREPYFSWNGKILYCEDVSGYFLNSDTAKIMMTGGSDIAVVDKGQLKSLKINGNPIFLCTSATAEPNKELNRRISSITLNSTEDQTKKILEFQSKTAVEGVPDYDQDLIDSSYLLSRVSVEIPFAQDLLESFPKTLQARTNFDRLLDVIKSSAALHQYSRKKNEKKIIANEQDLEVGLEIFNKLFPSRSTSLTHSQQKLINYLEQIKIAESAAELFREIGHFHYSQIGKMIKGLLSLADKGFVDIQEGERKGRPCDFYKYIPEKESTKVKVSKVSIVSKDSKVSEVITSSNFDSLSSVKPVELTQLTPLSPLPQITSAKESLK